MLCFRFRSLAQCHGARLFFSRCQHPKPPIPRLYSKALLQRRGLLTLAIETSCDDTAVAIIERHDDLSEGHAPKATLHFHEKITSNNTAFGGIHPLVALESHQENLAELVDTAIQHLPSSSESDCEPVIGLPRDETRAKKRRPDFISVTRGPGMRTNLQTGLDTAKGLAVAWGIPIVGVHHMQAHALTPRFVAAVESSDTTSSVNDEGARRDESPYPEFPFLSVLVSGGHTLIIYSASLTEHRILATTSDTAIGDYLDKAARAVLPPEALEGCKGTMYGAALERFAFPHIDSDGNQTSDYGYQPPKSLSDGLTKRMTRFGWGLKPPFAESPRAGKAKSLEISYGGLTTAVERIAKFSVDRNGKPNKVERDPQHFTTNERRELAQETMRVGFEHLTSRIILALDHIENTDPVTAKNIKYLVMSGGVAANRYLRHMLSATLKAQGYDNLKPVFPPPKWCTDNAAMIAWAGLEMFEAGQTTPLTARAIRKWPLDRLLEPPINE